MGLEHNAIIVRPAFYVWASGGDWAIFVGTYAQEAQPPRDSVVSKPSKHVMYD